jgi:flagellar hook protein FlgE
VTYTRSASGWNYTATLPGADVDGGTADTPFVVASGLLASDSFGVLSNPAAFTLPAINFTPRAVPLTTSYTPTGTLDTSLVGSVTAGSPYATVSVPQTVTDSFGNTDTVNLNFTFNGTTGFDYTTTVASNNLPGYVPGAPVTQVAVGSGGFLASDSAGNLSSTTPIAISVPNFVVPSTLTTSITPGAVQSSLSAAEASKDSSFNSTITIYDSLGTSHVLSVAYTRTTSGWDYNVTLPSSEVTGATGTTSLVANGHLTFDNTGNLTSTAPIALTIPNLADGAATLNLNWNLAGSTGAGLITQVSGASSTGSLQQDGYDSGSLTDFTIDANGTVEGTFTNGTKVLGQIALANFANLQGLTKLGNNNYAATISSGSAVIGSPGTSSLGTLTGKSLELSNVDMSTEFSNLIVAERGFQANAKSVTTFDQIAQDTINLIR